MKIMEEGEEAQEVYEYKKGDYVIHFIKKIYIHIIDIYLSQIIVKNIYRKFVIWLQKIIFKILITYKIDRFKSISLKNINKILNLINKNINMIKVWWVGFDKEST